LNIQKLATLFVRRVKQEEEEEEEVEKEENTPACGS